MALFKMSDFGTCKVHYIWRKFPGSVLLYTENPTTFMWTGECCQSCYCLSGLMGANNEHRLHSVDSTSPASSSTWKWLGRVRFEGCGEHHAEVTSWASPSEMPQAQREMKKGSKMQKHVCWRHQFTSPHRLYRFVQFIDEERLNKAPSNVSISNASKKTVKRLTQFFNLNCAKYIDNTPSVH